MTRVTGIGGVFFKSANPAALGEWYEKHLGIKIQFPTGAAFESGEKKETTVWSIFKQETKYLDPSTSPFMINYRVADLDALLVTLREEGVEIVGEPQSGEYGKFGWVMDPDGNKVELWEPPSV